VLRVYRHQLDGEVLHAAGGQCGTSCHLLCVTASLSLTDSNGSRKLTLIFVDSNEHHPWRFCDSGAVYKCDYLLTVYMLPRWLQENKLLVLFFRSVLS